MFLTAWPWFMDLGSMVFLSLVLVLAFRLIVLIFILTVAASFRVFLIHVLRLLLLSYMFSLLLFVFTPTERLSSLEADSDAIPQFLWFLLCTGRYLVRRSFMSRSGSRRSFRRGASNVHRLNSSTGSKFAMRSGIRL